MAKARLLGGKPLLISGKVALTDDCCCGIRFCPDWASVPCINVTFSGIVGCDDDLSEMNDTFTLSNNDPSLGTPQEFVWAGLGGTGHAGGPPPSDYPTFIAVVCTGDNTFQVTVGTTQGAGGDGIFDNVGGTIEQQTLPTVPNLLECGTAGIIAEGGTATINSISNNCQPCCIDTVCYEGTPETFAIYGGTSMSGSCVPNPCGGMSPPP